MLHRIPVEERYAGCPDSVDEPADEAVVLLSKILSSNLHNRICTSLRKLTDLSHPTLNIPF